MDQDVAKVYGNKVRVRACGICWSEHRLLLVNHRGITSKSFWAPPGGGVEFGESITETLKKEFREETGIVIEPGPFLFGCEFIEKPIHSIELFYAVDHVSGTVKTGFDPEVQIIQDVRFMSADEIRNIAVTELHGIFRFIASSGELKNLKGFFRI
jgi:8-oxo-dGTP diphosphatase